jgi:hypothetical protein
MTAKALGGDCGIELLRHGVLLVFGAPGQLKTLAGQEHGRTIPLADIGDSNLVSRDVLGSPSVPIGERVLVAFDPQWSLLDLRVALFNLNRVAGLGALQSRLVVTYHT